MAKPFKFRYVNEITGTFVLLVVLALIAGIIMAAHAQRWFEPVYRVELKFPPEGSLGLQKGSEVQILGATVGVVDEISVEDDGSMTGIITIRGNFYRFVREDSQAIAKKKFGIAGDAYVDITKGTNAPLPKSDAVMTIIKDTELMETVQEIVDQVRESVVPMLEKAQKAVEEYTKVAESLHDPKGNLQQLLANINELTEGLKKGEGTVGQILRDPEMAKQISEMTQKLNQALDDVKKILADVQQTTQQLPAMAETVGGEVKDLPGIVLQTQETMRETTRLIDAIQKHWLIRKYVDQTEPTTRIPPSHVEPIQGGNP
jgi:phospholipid/cholesterol/gamma-HCH transport system substrate-binding protein